MRAYNERGWGAQSGAFQDLEFRILEAPQLAPSLTLSQISPEAVRLTWTNITLSPDNGGTPVTLFEA